MYIKIGHNWKKAQTKWNGCFCSSCFGPVVSFGWTAQTNRNSLMFPLFQHIFHRLRVHQPCIYNGGKKESNLFIHIEWQAIVTTSWLSLVQSLAQNASNFIFVRLRQLYIIHICLSIPRRPWFPIFFFAFTLVKFKRSFFFVWRRKSYFIYKKKWRMENVLAKRKECFAAKCVLPPDIMPTSYLTTWMLWCEYTSTTEAPFMRPFQRTQQKMVRRGKITGLEHKKKESAWKLLGFSTYSTVCLFCSSNLDEIERMALTTQTHTCSVDLCAYPIRSFQSPQMMAFNLLTALVEFGSHP